MPKAPAMSTVEYLEHELLLLAREIFVDVGRALSESRLVPNLTAKAEKWAKGLTLLMALADLDARQAGKRRAFKFLTMPWQGVVELLQEEKAVSAEISRYVSTAYGKLALDAIPALEHDIVSSVQKSITSMLKEGSTVADFQEWSANVSNGKVSDAWAETTYRTARNLANTAGRMMSAMDPASNVVAWRYVTVGDEDVRKNHRANHGMMCAIDHNVWAERAPPNGYRCRCRLVNITRTRAEAMGRIDINGNFVSDTPKPKGIPDVGFQESPLTTVYGGLL